MGACKMYVDMHSHLGGWSPDAGQSVEMLLSAAKKKGLNGIAVTDHYEMDSLTADGRPWTFDTEQYWEQNAGFRKRPSESGGAKVPGILIGIEMGFLPGRIEETRELMRRGRFDCIILSLHAYEGIDPVTEPENMYTGRLSDTYSKVIGAMARMAEIFPEADIIGHYDFFSRYALQDDPKMLYSHAPEAFDRLFAVMIRNRQALEINTGTVEALHKRRGYTLEEAMPDEKIIRRYMELGGRLFTLGSDAHEETAVARYFEETAEWMRRHGIKEYSWMEERRWYSAPL